MKILSNFFLGENFQDINKPTMLVFGPEIMEPESTMRIFIVGSITNVGVCVCVCVCQALYQRVPHFLATDSNQLVFHCFPPEILDTVAF